MASSPVLPKETIAIVKARSSSLIGPEENGKRRISLGLISDASSDTSWTASTSPSTVATMPFISIPVMLESPQTYEYMGVTAEVAHQIYEARMKDLEYMRSQEGPDDFHQGIDFERYLTDNVVKACEYALRANGTDWVRAMTIAGVRKDLQETIMDPEFEDIRGMHSLPTWLRETFGINFRTLKSMNKRILAQSASPPTPLREGPEGEVV